MSISRFSAFSALLAVVVFGVALILAGLPHQLPAVSGGYLHTVHIV